MGERRRDWAYLGPCILVLSISRKEKGGGGKLMEKIHFGPFSLFFFSLLLFGCKNVNFPHSQARKKERGEGRREPSPFRTAAEKRRGGSFGSVSFVRCQSFFAPFPSAAAAAALQISRINQASEAVMLSKTDVLMKRGRRERGRGEEAQKLVRSFVALWLD